MSNSNQPRGFEEEEEIHIPLVTDAPKGIEQAELETARKTFMKFIAALPPEKKAEAHAFLELHFPNTTNAPGARDAIIAIESHLASLMPAPDLAEKTGATDIADYFDAQYVASNIHIKSINGRSGNGPVKKFDIETAGGRKIEWNAMIIGNKWVVVELNPTLPDSEQRARAKQLFTFPVTDDRSEEAVKRSIVKLLEDKKLLDLSQDFIKNIAQTTQRSLLQAIEESSDPLYILYTKKPVISIERKRESTTEKWKVNLTGNKSVEWDVIVDGPNIQVNEGGQLIFSFKRNKVHYLPGDENAFEITAHNNQIKSDLLAVLTGNFRKIEQFIGVAETEKIFSAVTNKYDLQR